MTVKFTPLLLAFTFMLAMLNPAIAAETPDKRMIAVTGTGIAKARPDTASISIGVVSDGATARVALDQNSAAMSAVNAALKTRQVEPKDIQTVDFSVRPKFKHFKDGKPPAITGYRVVNSVRITVRDLKNLGPILDQAVSLGSNRINGITFSIAEPRALEDTARKAAMDDARNKAQLYAHAGLTRLGKVLTITEDSVIRPPSPRFARAAPRSEAASVPIAPGETKLQARVRVTWELVD